MHVSRPELKTDSRSLSTALYPLCISKRATPPLHLDRSQNASNRGGQRVQSAAPAANTITLIATWPRPGQRRYLKPSDKDPGARQCFLDSGIAAPLRRQEGRGLIGGPPLTPFSPSAPWLLAAQGPATLGLSVIAAKEARSRNKLAFQWREDYRTLV